LQFSELHFQDFEVFGTLPNYDAFGNLIHSTGTTPNVYLFAGEQYDPDLHLYYNRARYLNTNTGRFWTMDSDEGDLQTPLSLHEYLYAEGDPADNTDPSGNEIDGVIVSAMSVTLDSMPQLNFSQIQQTIANLPAPGFQIVEEDVVKSKMMGCFKIFQLNFSVAANLIYRYVFVQWVKGTMKLNGKITTAEHQGKEEAPVNFKDWVIDT